MTLPFFPESSDHEFFALLAKARAGDADALGQVINRYRPYLLKIAYEEGDTNLQAKAGDSDLVQNTCLQAIRVFQEFQGRTSSEMRAWLRQILVHQVNDFRDQYQTNKRDIAAEVPLQTVEAQDSRNEKLKDAAASPSEQVMLQEESDWLERALDDLPEIERTIIKLRQQDGRPFSEIARTVGMSEEATQKRWARAIHSLREKVDRLHGRAAD